MPLLIVLVGLLVLAPAATAATPRAITLSRGWEMRAGRGGLPRPTAAAPREESAPENDPAPARRPPRDRRALRTARGAPLRCRACSTRRALPALYAGSVRSYRVRFRGPATPRGFRWKLVFESVRRSAGVYLNGRRIGRNGDPYTPFSVEAKGLRRGATNELVVVVDGRKDRRLREGWWNWNGIVRPVHWSRWVRRTSRALAPCRACAAVARPPPAGRPARRHARASQHPRGEAHPRRTAARSNGRVTRKRFRLPAQRAAKRHVRLSMRVPAPQLWSPDAPNLYGARFTLRERGVVQQAERRSVGLRSVTVKGGMLHLNNRRIQLRGASMHEDMPSDGAALTEADMDRFVADLEEVGANVTRAHYLLNDRLLAKLDRAGIFVWNQAPIGTRPARTCSSTPHRKRALLTVRRTVGPGATPLGAHPLGGQRAVVHPRREADHPPFPARRPQVRA